MKTLAYAGIGSRETPPDVLVLMTKIATRLAARGYTLRSGAAPGADTAFEQGAVAKEIWLPWKRFNQHPSKLEPHRDAYAMAARFHPNWEACNRAARSLHARNCHQVLGSDLSAPDPVHFVICWTRNANGAGGTGQALRIAKHYAIPIYDLGRSDRDNVLQEIAEHVMRNEQGRA